MTLCKSSISSGKSARSFLSSSLKSLGMTGIRNTPPTESAQGETPQTKGHEK